MYTGRTPYAGARNASRDGERVAPLLSYYLGMDDDLSRRLRLLGRYPAKDLKAFYAEWLRRSESGPVRRSGSEPPVGPTFYA